MRRRGLIALWVGLALVAHFLPRVLPAPPARADFPDEAPRTLTYRIEARLDSKTRLIDGQGTLTWKNTSPVEVTDMRFHLYLNAFKNKRSTFMRESLGKHRGHAFDEGAPGWIELRSVERTDEAQVIAPHDIEFLHEDDGNVDDRTVARFTLAKAIPAGGEATFKIAWQSQMPKVFARTGYAGAGAFFMVAQWYPKPGVWEKEVVGGEDVWQWNCHQFHGSSEFYADYGDYDVELTVPARFAGKVGATGKREALEGSRREDGGRENEDGSFTYQHRAANVHDFAWVCGESFDLHELHFTKEALTKAQREEQARVARILGVPTASLDLPEVTVYLLLQPEHEGQRARHKKAVFNALAYMGFWFGPYPYPTLTVVDPDHRGGDAGGMEYPTLITGGTRYIRAARQQSPEGVLVHEFGHQHFYGLVGSNEFRTAWMDEGMNTYGTAKVLMKAYDGYTAATWYAGLPVYGEPAFPFHGLAATARKAVPLVEPVFDRSLRIPFGDVAVVKSVAHLVGINHPPGRISLWGSYGEVTPLSFLREVPLLTHVHVRPTSSKEWERSAAARRAPVDPIDGRRAWEYMDRRSYGNNSYRRTASSLRTIEGYLGEETMVRIMRTYCERWRFRHPRPEDFFAVVNEVAKREGRGDVTWLLEQLFEGTSRLDFGIESVDVRALPKRKAEVEKKASARKPTFESLVVVRRFGGVRIPMDVRVRFEDGSVRDFRWGRDDGIREYALTPTVDGSVTRGVLSEDAVPPLGVALSRVTPQREAQARWVKLRFRGPVKVLSAEIDPMYAYGLDADRTNDGRSTKRDVGPSLQLAIRALGWVEMSTSFYGGL